MEYAARKHCRQSRQWAQMVAGVKHVAVLNTGRTGQVRDVRQGGANLVDATQPYGIFSPVKDRFWVRCASNLYSYSAAQATIWSITRRIDGKATSFRSRVWTRLRTPCAVVRGKP